MYDERALIQLYIIIGECLPSGYWSADARPFRDTKRKHPFLLRNLYAFNITIDHRTTKSIQDLARLQVSFRHGRRFRYGYATRSKGGLVIEYRLRYRARCFDIGQVTGAIE